MLLIDGNAGDGEGVPTLQRDLFDGARASRPTPRVLADLAEKHNTTLCLCERDKDKRRLLAGNFPEAIIVASHAEAAAMALAGFNYVLWLSDPCGPAGHGVEHMRRVASTQSVRTAGGGPRILRSDFIIVFNELAAQRFVGVGHAPKWQTHQKYTPMIEPAWWLSQLPKRFLARTPKIKQSSGFHFRVLVVSDFITDGVKRLHNIEIISR